VDVPLQSGEDGILGTEALHIACTEEVQNNPERGEGGDNRLLGH